MFSTNCNYILYIIFLTSFQKNYSACLTQSCSCSRGSNLRRGPTLTTSLSTSAWRESAKFTRSISRGQTPTSHPSHTISVSYSNLLTRYEEYLMEILILLSTFQLSDLSCLVYQKSTNTYAPYNKDWIKEKIYILLRRQASKAN